MVCNTIYTTFAGRRENLDIQMQYLDRLIDMGLINEVHMWDYTREVKDSIWIKRMFNIPSVFEYSAPNFVYHELPLSHGFIPSKSIKLGVKGRSNARIALTSYQINSAPLEIVLGEHNNTCCIVKHGDKILEVSRTMKLSSDVYSYFDIMINTNGNLLVTDCASQQSMSCLIPEYANLTKLSMHLAGFIHTSIDYDLSKIEDLDQSSTYPSNFYKPRNITSFKYMPTPRKHIWVDYYQHYTSARYPDHIIVKADDDIIFIDTNAFEDFINERKKDQHSLLVLPFILNNGVCAYHQQQHGLIPKEVGEFPYDPKEGKLWSSAELCSKLHRHFLTNTHEFIEKARHLQPITHRIGDRISINMFAILSKDLDVYNDVYHGLCKPNFNGIDDEHLISTVVPANRQRPLLIAPRLVIAHLSFFKQIEMGLNVSVIRDIYKEKLMSIKPATADHVLLKRKPKDTNKIL